MEETKEKKGKHRKKLSVIDIIFRVLILFAIFLTIIVFSIFYIRSVSHQILNDVNTVKNIQNYQ